MDIHRQALTRRAFLGVVAAGAAAAVSSSAQGAGPLMSDVGGLLGDDTVTSDGDWDIAIPKAPPMQASASFAGPRPREELLRRALMSLDRHASRGLLRDRVAVVDFSLRSDAKRMFLIDFDKGRSWACHVCHGQGSDPRGTGWVQKLSNVDGSYASSEGAYLTGEYYYGEHGHSQRLVGLDPTNSRAYARAIVLHGGEYAEPSVVSETGLLGRSLGCFTVGDSLLPTVMAKLGKNRLIYASKT
jgi:hypothetical protein